jgi:RecA/RadA recombinase
MAKLPSYFSNLIKAESAAVAATLLDAKKNTVVSTDSYTLDWATKGGFARGELTLLWGGPSSGKSTLMFKMMAREQKLFPDKFAVLIDTEYSFDANRAKQLGVDTDRLMVFQSNVFDKAIAPLAKITDEIIADKSVCFVGLDSIKGFQSVNESNAMSEGDVNSAANAYGGVSKTINPAMKILLRIAAETGCMVIMTNHANMNMDPRTSKYYPYILTGGQTMKHLLATSVFMDKVEGQKAKIFANGITSVNNSNVAIGNIVRCKVTKSRRTVEGKVGEIYWNLETGEFERKEEELLRLAESLGVVWKEGSGRTLFMGPKETAVKLGGQREAVITKLINEPNLQKRMWLECQEVQLNPSLTINTEILDTETPEAG